MQIDELAKDIREDFPILKERVGGEPLIYLDSGATSHKPRQVIEALEKFYKHQNSNVHRGAHTLAARATDAYEGARDKLARFIGADREEVVFTSGATDAINLVARTWGEENLKEGDEILLTVMEHHANLVPWQILAKKTGAVLKFVTLDENECMDLELFKSLLSPQTKLASFVHVSNALACKNPVKEAIDAAHAVGAKVLVDACQSVPHLPVDVKSLDVDWLVASGHKMLGPTGIGFLYGKKELLDSMPPFRGGGEMIDRVELESSTFLPAPARFEAGTPPIAQAVGLGAAVDYLQDLGMDSVERFETEMGRHLYERLRGVDGLRVYGPDPAKCLKGRAGLAAFNHRSAHPSDLSAFLNHEGVAVRAGHHCTQPLHKILGVPGSCRASLYLYNTADEIDRFVDALKRTLPVFDGLEGGPVDLLPEEGQGGSKEGLSPELAALLD